MKTILTANIVLTTAFEAAMDNVTHHMLDGFEIFPERSVEIYMRTLSNCGDNITGVEECTFRCKLHKRTTMGWAHTIPLQWDAWCLLIPQFHIKSIKRPNGWRASDMSEFWWERFKEVIDSAIELTPEAVFDEGSKTWWIGDYGFNTETQEAIKK